MTSIMKRIYLDYAASTPVDRRVMEAMAPYFNEKFGNPGSLHWFGQEAEAAVFDARQKIARALACSPEEIIFTGSATEVNNTVLRGIVRMANSKLLIVKPKIIISSIEHESVMETAADLEREGAEVVRIPVSREGFVNLEKLKAALAVIKRDLLRGCGIEESYEELRAELSVHDLAAAITYAYRSDEFLDLAEAHMKCQAERWKYKDE